MPDKLPEPVVSEIHSLIETQLAAAQVPGAAVGIVQDGQLTAFIGHGMTDLKTGSVPTSGSIARVASVTKTFTATAIMQLRDASLLALDDPLLLHIPEFTNAQAVAAPLEGVTIRRMLTHYSGLSTEHPDLDWDTPDFPTREHLMDSLEQVKVVIPPDSQWKYSNLAFSLLGEVVSRLSGKPYTEYVYDEIIGPLGMANTAYDLSPDQQKMKMTGYSPPYPEESDLRIAPVGHLKGFSAAGQLQTNVEDLAKWIGFQTGGGPETVLSMQSRAEMQRPVYVASDWSSGQGLAWRAVRQGDRVYWNHGGGVHGFATSVLYNVPARTGVVVLLNTWPTGAAHDLALSIAELVIGKTGLVSAARKPSVEEANVPGEFAREFTGSYWAEPGVPLTVVGTRTGINFAMPKEGGTQLHSPARLETTVDPDGFKVVNGRGAGETAVFTRNESGDVTGFSLGGFKYRKLG